MKSPAQRHYLRTVAARRAVAEAPEPAGHANAYELMLARLAEHRRQLKQLQSVERKIEAKRTMLPDYAPWIEGVLQGGRGGQDDVLVTVLVWMIDVGDLAGALLLAEYALEHGLTMPDHYQRGIACVVAEEFAEAALKQIAAGVSVDAEALRQACILTAEHDMPDEARAKLLKAIGYAERETSPAEALCHLKAALQLHDKVGVKKDIERLERELKNQAKADPGQG